MSAGMNAVEDCGLCGDSRESERAGRPFALLASTGALSVGHALMCPVAHVRSVTALGPTDAQVLLDLAERATGELAALTGVPVHCFEHGNAWDGRRVACSVEHAHMHLLPGELDLDAELGKVATWLAAPWSARVLSEMTRGREYLLYRRPDGRVRIWISDGQPIPSQLMRRLAARGLGYPEEWNWRTHPAIVRTAETMALLGGLAERLAPASQRVRISECVSTQTRAPHASGFSGE
jgi:ATP adenylyltransferase